MFRRWGGSPASPSDVIPSNLLVREVMVRPAERSAPEATAREDAAALRNAAHKPMEDAD